MPPGLGIVPQIATILDESRKKGLLGQYLSKPDQAWQTMGDTGLQKELYRRLKEAVPCIDAAGLTKATESVLCNASLAELAQQCGMEELTRTWSKAIRSAHDDQIGKEADAVEALYFFCSDVSEDSGLRQVAHLMVCQLFCKRIAKLYHDASAVKFPVKSQVHSMDSGISQAKEVPSTSSTALPESVVGADMKELNEAFQRTANTHQILVSWEQVDRSDKPAWKISTSCDGKEDGPILWKDVRKAQAILLAKIHWLHCNKPAVYQNLLSQLKA